MICASLFCASILTLGASSGLDAVSSYGQFELNSVLGKSQFGTSQTLKKSALTGGVISGELLFTKERKLTRREKLIFVIVNFGVAGVYDWAAYHNFKLRGK